VNQEDSQKILNFLHLTEKLKTIKRHSWLSNGRQETVAEHTWRMALMAMLIAPYLDKKVDLLKTIKMVLVHDLSEINYKDNPAHLGQPLDKALQEEKSLKKLTRGLPQDLKKEINDLWQEYESAESFEARFAKTMDKTEVLLQHYEADIKFMHKTEFALNFYHGKEFGEHDSFLKLFRELINAETLKHYQKNKIDKKLYQDYI
jgi:putative hydrolase of HD superfamily